MRCLLNLHIKFACCVTYRWRENLEKIAPNLVLVITKYGLIFSLAQTLLTLDKRPNFLNIIYMFYGIALSQKYLYEILIDDDMSKWTSEKKFYTLLFPVSHEDKKMMGKDLHAKQTEKQVKTKVRKAMNNMDGRMGPWMEFMLYVPIMMGVSTMTPQSLTLIIQTICFHYFLNALAPLISIGMTSAFKNLYPPMFGDNVALFTSGTKVYEHGFQYEYFANSNRYLNDVLHKNVFKKIKGTGPNAAQAKAAMILARAGLVMAGMWLFQYDRKMIGFVGLYYAIHAGFAYRQHNGDDIGKVAPIRFVFGVLEILLSSFLWTAPIMSGEHGPLSNGPDVISVLKYVP